MNKRLRQPVESGAQLRMFAASEMPGELLAPLEKDVVSRTRRALEKMGYKTWSGRVAIYDVSPEAKKERAERGWPAFLPALEPGCPDVLGIMPERKGRFFGLEFKRDSRSTYASLDTKERASQKKWHEMAAYWGIICGTVRSVDEAIAFVEAHRF
jgi:hypothetical protein